MNIHQYILLFFYTYNTILLDIFKANISFLVCVFDSDNCDNIRNFMSAARAVARIKPIIALKSNRSQYNLNTDEDEMYDAVFKRAGILRVNELDELFDCAEFLAKQKRPLGCRLAIVSNAGGMGVMAQDALAKYGIEPAKLSDDTINSLIKILGDKMKQLIDIQTRKKCMVEIRCMLYQYWISKCMFFFIHLNNTNTNRTSCGKCKQYKMTN